jgi:tetratricopeptide (TPR) repeat protein
LQEGDPANTRFLLNRAYVTRKMGEALATLGRNAESSRCFGEALALSAGLGGSRGDSEAAVSVELAKLKARSGDRGALALADAARAYHDKAKTLATNAWARAMIYADLAGVYRKFGRAELASDCAGKSMQLWQEMKLPAALEKRRAQELATVKAASMEYVNVR